MLRPDGGAATPSAPAVTPGQTAASVLTKALRNAEQRSGDGMSWKVTQANSAHDVMVVGVQTNRTDEARVIAEEIVAPLKDNYQEVLIYVRGTNEVSDSLVQRIQWTPDGGYVETIYNEQ